jgi:2-isopropylmalate synthase
VTRQPSLHELTHDWGNPRLPASFRGVVDETIRDGLQAPHAPALTLAQKLDLLSLSAACGISDIIIGNFSPYQGHKLDLISLARHCAGLSVQPWVLCRLLAEDIEELMELDRQCGGCLGLNVFIAMSDLRLYVEGWNTSEVFSNLSKCLALGRKHFRNIRVALEDAVRTKPDVLSEAIGIICSEGATRLTLADTAGVSTPASVRNLFRFVAPLCSSALGLEWHGHNDRGLGDANSLESIQYGAHFVHGTMLGVGERNGNAALDILLLNHSLELEGRFNWNALAAYHSSCRQLFAGILDDRDPYFGKNTFATSTGTHCAAMTKALDMGRADLAMHLYSPPSVFSNSRRPSFLISPLSGRRCIKAVLEGLHLPSGDDIVSGILNTVRARGCTLSLAELKEHFLELTETSADSPT